MRADNAKVIRAGVRKNESNERAVARDETFYWLLCCRQAACGVEPRETCSEQTLSRCGHHMVSGGRAVQEIEQAVAC